MIVGFRKQAPLVLDRLALHCCLCYDDQPSTGQGGATSLVRRRSKSYPIGFFHLDIAEVRTEEGRPLIRC